MLLSVFCLWGCVVLESLVVEASESYRGEGVYFVYFDHLLGYTDVTSKGRLPSTSDFLDESIRKRREPFLYVTRANTKLFLEIVHYADLIHSRKDAYAVLRRLSAI